MDPKQKGTPLTIRELPNGYSNAFAFAAAAAAAAAGQVFSWDTSKNGPRTDDSKGRSYISAISEVTTGESCSGKAKNNMGEARMDIEDSEMAYLGYHGAEAYGLTWKV